MINLLRRRRHHEEEKLQTEAVDTAHTLADVEAILRGMHEELAKLNDTLAVQFGEKDGDDGSTD